MSIRAVQDTLDQQALSIRAIQDTLDQQALSIRAIQDTLDQLPEALGRVRASLLQSASQDFRQTEALLSLHSLVRARAPLPQTRGWAASPDLLLFLVSLVISQRPRLIVELGSGVSTLWLAYALEKAGGDGRIVSLDHDPEFAARTQAFLVAHEVDRFVSVRVAPLVEVDIDDEKWPWYDRQALADVDSCELLVVDGPPGAVRDRARFPALPVLRRRLAEQATIVLDDCIRSDEKEIVAAWHASLPEWDVEMLPHEKVTAVFSRKIGR
jgi:hypothetical protein